MSFQDGTKPAAPSRIVGAACVGAGQAPGHREHLGVGQDLRRQKPGSALARVGRQALRREPAGCGGGCTSGHRAVRPPSLPYCGVRRPARSRCKADLWAAQPDSYDLVQRVEEIVRRGRLRGFMPCQISERRAVLHKDVLSQADILVSMRLTSSQDKEAVGVGLRASRIGPRGGASWPPCPGLHLWTWSRSRRRWPRRMCIRLVSRNASPGNATPNSRWQGRNSPSWKRRQPECSHVAPALSDALTAHAPVTAKRPVQCPSRRPTSGSRLLHGRAYHTIGRIMEERTWATGAVIRDFGKDGLKREALTTGRDGGAHPVQFKGLGCHKSLGVFGSMMTFSTFVRSAGSFEVWGRADHDRAWSGVVRSRGQSCHLKPYNFTALQVT